MAAKQATTVSEKRPPTLRQALLRDEGYNLYLFRTSSFTIR